ncbi:MAG: UDP-3-O-(3-hydroxymyristoyl)glucosamine N-acyltransferase [Bacteroidaceae bacterium]|nr:UDP-3-O-(3-hydroxymyristoyl)glucosamine N-acyltransferase [Bacteroidaceae bacterium]
MEFTAEMIAGMVQGTVEGNPKAIVNDFAKIEEGRPGCISFLANPKYAHYLYETKSSVVLVNRDFQLEGKTEATLIRVDNAYETIAKLLAIYDSMKPKRSGIDPLAYVAPTAKIGKDVFLAPFSAVGDNAVIGDGAQLHPHATVGANAVIGENTIMYSNAVVYHDCKVGKRCILHAGSVIGADGFGFAPTEEGYEKIPQIGIVTIEDDVEIGANTCVDRSTMGSTIVRRGVKLDNLVQIAHNCEVGQHTVMSAQVGVAGSTRIGEWCMFGGQVGIAGHATIANRTMAGAQAGIPNSIKKEGQAVQGTPAIDGKIFWRSSAVFKNLPEVWTTVNRLTKQVAELQAQIEELKGNK